MTPCGSNVYSNPNMEIISPSRNVLDLGIYMSGDCTFIYHISSLSKKCANLSERIQRTFYTMNDMPHHERLESRNLLSAEKNCIIYNWIIIEGLAPNFSNPITSTFSGRRGRSCVISHVNVGRVGTLSYNSFRWRSIRLFNSLPMHLRSISSCSVLRFKTQLNILGSVEDLPCRQGFNNSLDSGDCIWWSPCGL